MGVADLDSLPPTPSPQANEAAATSPTRSPSPPRASSAVQSPSRSRSCSSDARKSRASQIEPDDGVAVDSADRTALHGKSDWQARVDEDTRPHVLAWTRYVPSDDGLGGRYLDSHDGSGGRRIVRGQSYLYNDFKFGEAEGHNPKRQKTVCSQVEWRNAQGEPQRAVAPLPSRTMASAGTVEEDEEAMSEEHQNRGVRSHGAPLRLARGSNRSPASGNGAAVNFTVRLVKDDMPSHTIPGAPEPSQPLPRIRSAIVPVTNTQTEEPHLARPPVVVNDDETSALEPEQLEQEMRLRALAKVRLAKRKRTQRQ